MDDYYLESWAADNVQRRVDKRLRRLAEKRNPEKTVGRHVPSRKTASFVFCRISTIYRLDNPSPAHQTICVFIS